MRSIKKGKTYIETKHMSLEEWLNLILNPPADADFIDYEFPTDKHREEYITNLDNYSELDVMRLLEALLIPSGGLGIDSSHLESFEGVRIADPEMYKRMVSTQYFRRLIRYASGVSKIPPWEGITWILDLLPYWPKDALEGLNAYILAHAQLLPDGRYRGLYDASEVIRAKFIGLPGTNDEKIKFLLSLDWRDFECLVERLYANMGYETELTPAQKDGGKDILAGKRIPANLEHLRIECKLYDDRPVGIEIVQRLLGVVSSEKVNKGVVVTTSRFSKPAAKYAEENPRLELIDGDQLVLLLNEHLGPRWPLHIDRLIAESQQEQQKKKTSE